jgi:hypothetical protein
MDISHFSPREERADVSFAPTIIVIANFVTAKPILVFQKQEKELLAGFHSWEGSRWS